MTLSTDPMQETMLTLKERRPFSLALTVEKQDKSRLNLTGASARLVISDVKRKGGDVKVTAVGALLEATQGTMRFDIQAENLNFGSGTYDMAITLTTTEGFASSIIEGQVELTHNPDPTIPADYATVVPPLSLTATIRDQNRVTVRVNHHPDSVLLDLVEQVQDASGAAAAAASAAAAAQAAAAASMAAADARAAAAAAAAASAGGSAADVQALVLQAQQAASQAQQDAATSTLAASNAISAANAAATSSGDALFHAANAQTYSNQASSYSTDSYNHAQSALGYAQAAQATLAEAVLSDDVDRMRVMTQAAYDALGSKDARTLYVIVG